MVFYPPSWAPKMPFDPPDTVPICDFVFNDEHGRHPIADSKDPFTCGLSGRTYTTQEMKDRSAWLARSLAKELGWEVNEGSEFDKCVNIFALNTVRKMMS